MAIVYNPTTKKYSIVKSSADFYKSHPSSATKEKYGVSTTGGVVDITPPRPEIVGSTQVTEQFQAQQVLSIQKAQAQQAQQLAIKKQAAIQAHQIQEDQRAKLTRESTSIPTRSSTTQPHQIQEDQRAKLQKPIQPIDETTPTLSGWHGWLEKYRTTEKKVSEKLYDITGFSEEEHEWKKAAVLRTGERMQTKAEEQKKSWDILGHPLIGTIYGGSLAVFGKTGTLIAGAAGSVAKKTIDYPITAVATPIVLGGIGYGAGLAVAGGGALIGGTSGAFATGAFGGGISALAIPTLKVAGVSLAISYVYGVGTTVKSAPTLFEKGGIIAEAALETAAVGGGYASGSQRATKIGDWWRTRGRVELPVEDYVIPDVLSGKARFVESRSYGYTGDFGKSKQKFDIAIFGKKDTSFHVTPATFWKDGKFVTTRGTSEFPGLYVAPSVSVQFAKVGGSPSYKISLFGSGLDAAGKPAVAKFKGIKYTIDPASKTGAAYVTGVKPEIEAVIPVGQSFGAIDKSGYFVYKGRRIPVDVFKKIGGTPAVSGADIGVSLSGAKPSGSYSAYTTPSYPIYSPITTSISSLTSTTTSTPFSISISTITPSIISYTVPPQSPPVSYISPPIFSSGGSSGGGSPPKYIPPSLPSIPSQSPSVPLSTITLKYLCCDMLCS